MISDKKMVDGSFYPPFIYMWEKELFIDIDLI